MRRVPGIFHLRVEERGFGNSVSAPWGVGQNADKPRDKRT
jgi:hypothetical protein